MSTTGLCGDWCDTVTTAGERPDIPSALSFTAMRTIVDDLPRLLEDYYKERARGDAEEGRPRGDTEDCEIESKIDADISDVKVPRDLLDQR